MNSERIDTGILLNALVMPGAGHAAIGQRRKGCALALAVLVLLCVPIVFFTLALANALEVIPADAGALTRASSAIGVAWNSEARLVVRCLIGVFALWAYGITDLLIIRRKLRARMRP
ncbi:MAG TPA: hypothetical protein PLZ86_04660 [bacterium]|nr:hypothetical protein [bacterium]